MGRKLIFVKLFFLVLLCKTYKKINIMSCSIKHYDLGLCFDILNKHRLGQDIDDILMRVSKYLPKDIFVPIEHFCRENIGVCHYSGMTECLYNL